MNKLVKFVVGLLLILLSLTIIPMFESQGSQCWVRTGGGIGSDKAYSVAAVGSDIYVAGLTQDLVSGVANPFLTRFNESGDQIWIRLTGGSRWDEAKGVAVEGSNIYVAGWTESFGAGGEDAFLLKYDQNGNQIWSRTWGGSGLDKAQSVAVGGSNIYVVGYGESFGAGSADAFLLKYDQNGNQIWSRTWGGSLRDKGYGVAVLDSYVYVAGWTESFGAGSSDAFLLKYDQNGNQIWSRTWGGSGWDEAKGVAVAGSNIYVTGRTESFGAGSSDAFLLKYDQNGNQIWSRTWGGSGWDTGYGVDATSSYVYVAGWTGSGAARGRDILLLKYDQNGNQIWSRTWGGNDLDRSHSVAAVDSSIYVAGLTRSRGTSWDDAFLLKCPG